MTIRSLMQFMLGLVLALLAAVAAQAVNSPGAPNQIAIVSTSDVWAELAPCG